MSGAALMGIGGVIALGCSIGQGITGLSTLALGSIITTAAIIVGAALWLEVSYEPPMWVYFVIFLPLTLIVCLGMLRPLKGVLVALQYANRAEQGRLEG